METPFNVVALKLHRKVWEGNAKLWAEEIGMKQTDIPDNVKLGHKKLYPEVWRKQFHNVVAAARYYLKVNTLPHIVENIRACPAKRLADIVAHLEEFQRQYEDVKRSFLESYRSIQEEWREKYPDQWERNQDYYPEPEKIAKKFELSWDIFQISGISAKEVDAEDVRQAYAIGKARLDQRVAEMADAGIKMLRGKVAETFENLQEKIRTGKIVRHQTLDSVRDVINWFSDMNIYDDNEVEAKLREANEILVKLQAGDLKDSDVAQKVEAVATEVLERVRNIGDVDTVAGNYRRALRRIEE